MPELLLLLLLLPVLAPLGGEMFSKKSMAAVLVLEVESTSSASGIAMREALMRLRASEM